MQRRISQRRISVLVGLGVMALTMVLALDLVSAQDKKNQVDEKNIGPAKDIDLVLCLDTSNSMDGLIAAAKNKLWDLVNDLAKIKPAPNLRVALYSYGNDGYDPKKGWVRKELDFGTDLDMVFKKLFELKTHGGTEYVARVCSDAIKEQAWSKDKNALRLIFVCGNEPAAQDPTITLKELAALAVARDIIINPIYCGNADDGDGQDWRLLSALGHGKFANIDQNQRVAVINTPFDKELAELGLKLNTTYVTYGKEGEAKGANQKAQTANSGSLGVSNAAARTISQNSAFYRQAAWDLVDKLKEDPKLDIKKIPESELCDELKKLSPDDRVKFVKDKAAQRETLQKRISELTDQRNGYVRQEMEKQTKRGVTTLDEALRTTIREQAKTKGIEVPD
jgi:hypothetical protein